MYSKEEKVKPINNHLTCEFFIFFLKASTSTLLSFATITILKIRFFLGKIGTSMLTVTSTSFLSGSLSQRLLLISDEQLGCKSYKRENNNSSNAIVSLPVRKSESLSIASYGEVCKGTSTNYEMISARPLEDLSLTCLKSSSSRKTLVLQC